MAPSCFQSCEHVLPTQLHRKARKRCFCFILIICSVPFKVQPRDMHKAAPDRRSLSARLIDCCACFCPSFPETEWRKRKASRRGAEEEEEEEDDDSGEEMKALRERQREELSKVASHCPTRIPGPPWGQKFHSDLNGYLSEERPSENM